MKPSNKVGRPGRRTRCDVVKDEVGQRGARSDLVAREKVLHGVMPQLLPNLSPIHFEKALQRGVGGRERGAVEDSHWSSQQEQERKCKRAVAVGPRCGDFCGDFAAEPVSADAVWGGLSPIRRADAASVRPGAGRSVAF
jgi:hypothetical protein